MRALKLFVVSICMSLLAISSFGANCKWNTSPTTIPFGTYSVFNATDTATSTGFSFRCNPNEYARLILSTGTAGVFLPNRTMSNGANIAKYNIYLDAGGSMVWGDASGGSVSYDTFNASPGDKDYAGSMFGIMPNSQDLATGVYGDTVFATLQYSNNVNGPWNSQAPVSVAVSATVVSECRVDAFTLDFGNYNPFTVAATAGSTSLKVYCTKGGAPTSVTLNNGSFFLVTNRMQSAAAAFLNYSASLGSTSGSSTSSLVPINGGFALNGSVPAQQDVATGLYQDTLVATINY